MLASMIEVKGNVVAGMVAEIFNCQFLEGVFQVGLRLHHSAFLVHINKGPRNLRKKYFKYFFS